MHRASSRKNRHNLIDNDILMMSMIDPDCPLERLLLRVGANVPILARQLVKSIPILSVYCFRRKVVECNARAVITRQLLPISVNY